MNSDNRYKSFADFWPFYLGEHRHPTSRRLHFIGTSLVILIAIAAIFLQVWWILFALPVCGYAFAWCGHFVFEKNRPATFKYPFYSLAADFVMFYKILTGKLKDDLKKLPEK